MSIREFLKNIVTYDIRIVVEYAPHQDGIIVKARADNSKQKEVWIGNEVLFDNKVSDEQFKEYLLESLNPLIK